MAEPFNDHLYFFRAVKDGNKRQLHQKVAVADMTSIRMPEV
jgi:hypothetical protein